MWFCRDGPGSLGLPQIRYHYLRAGGGGALCWQIHTRGSSQQAEDRSLGEIGLRQELLTTREQSGAVGRGIGAARTGGARYAKLVHKDQIHTYRYNNHI